MVRGKKTFYVIAYDIADNKRRRKVVKVVERYGGRINLSVFECMLDRSQLDEMVAQLDAVISHSDDQLAFYPLCLDCYAKLKYLPDVKRDTKVVFVM